MAAWSRDAVQEEEGGGGNGPVDSVLDGAKDGDKNGCEENYCL